MKKQIFGFTLVELLVVVSIMNILGSTILSSLNQARSEARDRQRLYDMRRIQLAANLYYDDYGHYPDTTTPENANPYSWSCFTCEDYSTTTVSNPSAPSIKAALKPYLKTTPRDPSRKPRINGGNDDGKENESEDEHEDGEDDDGGYLYTGAGSSYCVVVNGTPENMNNFPKETWNMKQCKAVNAAGQCSGRNSVRLYSGTQWSTGC